MSERSTTEGRMRVAFVIGQLSAGGAEGQLAQLARALKAAGYPAIVYCMSRNDHPVGPEIRAAGIEVRVFAGTALQKARQLSRALVRDQVELVHAWLFIGNAYAWFASLFAGMPALITSARNCKRQGRIWDFANRRAFRASCRILVNSHLVGDYVQKHYGAPPDRLRVIYNGVDVRRFRPREGRDAAGAPTIVGIGRLVAQKNPLLFVEAAAQLARTHPRARFVFVGEGPMRGVLQRVVHERGLDEHFSLPGETRDVAAVLANADLFWLTSSWEGLPNVVLEAMASGVPVIASDVGGTRELVRSGRDGFLVQAGDVDAILHYSRALLADGAACAAVAHSARQRAQRFATDLMVERVKDLYAEALGSAA